MTVIQYHGRRDRENESHPDSRPGHASKSANAALVSPMNQNNADADSSTRIRYEYQLLPLEDNIFMSFTQANIMDGHQHYATSLSWLAPEKGQLALKCYLALSTTYFGAEHREPNLVRRGLYQYGKALRELNLALGDSSRCQSYDLLESVVVMATFEARLKPKNRAHGASG
jgi:hypothetical protein